MTGKAKQAQIYVGMHDEKIRKQDGKKLKREVEKREKVTQRRKRQTRNQLAPDDNALRSVLMLTKFREMLLFI